MIVLVNNIGINSITTCIKKVYILNIIFFRMVERKSGDRSEILLNTVDVIILDLVHKRKEVFTLWLNEYLKINNKSLRNHIARLEDSKFITKNQVEGTNKYLLHITPAGEKVLEIFGKIIKK